MTWYLWVWGAISSVAGLALVVGVVVVIVMTRKDTDKRERWRIELDEEKERSRYWRAEFEAVSAKKTKLHRKVLELESKLNEFGHISP